MINVEIYVPALLKEFEFQLDENEKVSTLIDEIASIISAKEKKEWASKTDSLRLCSVEDKAVLPDDKLLYQCGINQGRRLILI